MQLLQYELNGRRFTGFDVPLEALSVREETALRLNVAHAVLPVVITETDDAYAIAFDTEETEPFAGWFRRNRGRWDAQGDAVLAFASSIVRGLLDAEDHFLPLALFTLDETHIRIDPRDERLYLVPDPDRRIGKRESGADDVDRLRTELAAFLNALGSGLSDGAWNDYRKRFFADLAEETGGLLALYGFLERARRELCGA